MLRTQPRKARTAERRRTVWENARVVLPLAAVQSALYFALNHFPQRPSRLLPLTVLDQWVPFWPWTVGPYFALIAGQVILALFVRDRLVFRRALAAYVLGMGASLLTFLLW